MLDDLMQEAHAVAESYALIRAVADVDQTDNALRFRLIIDDRMFIQVYANSKKNKLKFALVSSGQRVFGRDSEGGTSHNHPSGQGSMKLREDGQSPCRA